ncbi:hypothetical protein M758_7G097900 [Ceratodon purpureus]|nr:hypothetical protein M758_7G097900 [Ceratodon purpureus]
MCSTFEACHVLEVGCYLSKGRAGTLFRHRRNSVPRAGSWKRHGFRNLAIHGSHDFLMAALRIGHAVAILGRGCCLLDDNMIGCQMERICLSIPKDSWSPAFQTRTLSTKIFPLEWGV